MAVHVPPRIYRRVPFATTVRLCYDRFRGFVEENSANLSLGGMFIQTDERPPLGTELSIEFRLEDGFELIRGTGRVAWVRDEPAGPELPAGIGVRFLELTPGSRELIFRLVDRRVKEGKTPFDLDEAAPHEVAPGKASPAAAEAGPGAPDAA
ncbi:MAG TPA: TIGR02266 family protein, partial [Thermoanaerobaculia bacterium]|nr:TIGR02266 family protein [Thermoanaerobaculia bacterium]